MFKDHLTVYNLPQYDLANIANVTMSLIVFFIIGYQHSRTKSLHYFLNELHKHNAVNKNRNIYTS